MKSRALLGLNGLLAVASVLFAAQIVRTSMAPGGLAPGVPRTSGTAAASARAGAVPGPSDLRPGLTSYATIASKNLFHPRRSDADAAATTATPAGPKPFLHGVVLRDEGSIAYLEDPASKRVTGYRVGDAIGGATIQSIGADRVVLKRSDGVVDVRLRDPGKPRQVAAEPPAPGQPGAAGQVPPVAGRPPIQPPAASAPGPGVAAPGAPLPGARVPPSLLRRLPQPLTPQPAAPTDADQ